MVVAKSQANISENILEEFDSLIIKKASSSTNSDPPQNLIEFNPQLSQNSPPQNPPQLAPQPAINTASRPSREWVPRKQSASPEEALPKSKPTFEDAPPAALSGRTSWEATLVVSGLPFSSTLKDLYEFCGDHMDHVTSVDIAKDERGNSLGYGVVYFSRAQDCLDAYQAKIESPQFGDTLVRLAIKYRDENVQNSASREAVKEKSAQNRIKKGINFDKYDAIPVFATGRKVPAMVESFEQIHLAEPIYRNVLAADFTKPTPIQKYAIPAALALRDLMACAETGSGKTAAFLLPVLSLLCDSMERNRCTKLQDGRILPRALILCPTRELALQILEEAYNFSSGTTIRPGIVYGGRSCAGQLKTLKSGCDILVGTPGRLIQCIEEHEISLSRVKHVVLDEADRMFDLGFEPQIRRILLNKSLSLRRQCLMFSATFPKPIQELASEFLDNYIYITVGRVGAATHNVRQSFFEVGEHAKFDQLLDILAAKFHHENSRCCLVFVKTKAFADILCDRINNAAISCASLHGDLDQPTRGIIMDEFRSGIFKVLVATNLASRGLDIPTVECVINYDLPMNVEEFVHRIGRTGRCGNVGDAISFFDPQCDAHLLEDLVWLLSESQQEIPFFMKKYLKFGFKRENRRLDSRDARRMWAPQNQQNQQNQQNHPFSQRARSASKKEPQESPFRSIY